MEEQEGTRPCGPTRRALMAGSLAIAAAACEPLGYAAPEREEDQDIALVRRAAAGEEDLIARYDAVRRRHPRLAARLDPLAREHAEHLRVLRGRLARVAPATSPRPPARPSVPAEPAAATAALAARERAAATHRLGDLVAASPPLAQLLASISACEAVHAALLSEDLRT